jgi:L-histidine N-alpha-methyltransferase
MTTPQTPCSSDGLITIDDVLTARGSDVLVADVVAGLSETPKRISSMFLYDDRGSQLFEEITALPEYYPTRTEKGLLADFAETTAPGLSDLDVVELGSGDCSKISLIFDRVDGDDLPSIRYVPVDVSEFAIRQSADELTAGYPGLTIHGLVADFLSQLDCVPGGRARIFCLLGSTIGNLSVSQRRAFLTHLADIMNPGDEFLLGIDLVKPVDILVKAYNDGDGVTAEFNRNILSAVNDLAGTDFRPEWFDHVAFYNPNHARMEMHLRATRDMEVRAPVHPGKSISIRRGETIHTENSHKFTLPQARRFLEAAGLKLTSCLQDPKHWFALLRAKPASRGTYVGC